MILHQTQQYAIQINGSVLSKHFSEMEAQAQLLSLKSTNNPLYESATISIVTEDNKSLLLG
jgi:hypothetical protein